MSDLISNIDPLPVPAVPVDPIDFKPEPIPEKMNDEDFCKALVVALEYAKVMKDEYQKRYANAAKRFSAQDRGLYSNKLLTSCYSYDGMSADDFLFPLNYSKMKKNFIDKLSRLDFNETEIKLLEPIMLKNG